MNICIYIYNKNMQNYRYVSVESKSIFVKLSVYWMHYDLCILYCTHSNAKKIKHQDLRAKQMFFWIDKV